MYSALLFIVICFGLADPALAKETVNLKTKQATTQENLVKQQMARVEIDIFSGLPNPQWQLTAAQTAEFDQLLASLSPTKQVPPAMTNLGFRGVLVHRNLNESHVIYKNQIWNLLAQNPVVYEDNQQALTTWLLTISQHQLPAALYGVVANELKP